MQLEREQGIPRNPFINAGALVVSDINLAGHEPRVAIGELLRFVRYLADDDSIIIDEAVARAEQATGFRNIALANYMKAFGNIQHAPELTLGVYFHQCAIAMSCRQLAMAGRYLMHGGLHEPGGPRVVSAQRARRINALMLTCGHYDASGDFAFRVGLPGKSGVGGGILAIAPGKAAIAVWSPGSTPTATRCWARSRWNGSPRRRAGRCSIRIEPGYHSAGSGPQPLKCLESLSAWPW